MDAVCLGILVADVFSSPVDRVPREGELCLADEFLLNAGGCAVNTAGCLRRLGKSVRVVGKVGTDLFGDFVVRDLARLDIDASKVIRSTTHPTASTFILNVRGEDRRYIHVVGANGDLRGADIDLSVLDDVRVLYVGGYLAMPAFTSADLARLFRQARQRGVKTVLDVIMPAGRMAPLSSIEEALPFTDLFVPNEDEARGLTGIAEPAEQAALLAAINPECTVVITRGKKGVLVRRGAELWRAGCYTVPSVDESGAGDAFAAGMVTGLAEGWPLEYMLRFASALGASCTQALGCTAGVLRYDEARRFVEHNTLRVEKLSGEESPGSWR